LRAVGDQNEAAKSTKTGKRIIFYYFCGGNTSFERLMTNAADGDRASAAQWSAACGEIALPNTNGKQLGETSDETPRTHQLLGFGNGLRQLGCICGARNERRRWPEQDPERSSARAVQGPWP
jgi:hypothetical protein